MNTEQVKEVASSMSGTQLIASATNVDGNVAGTTNLTFASGITLANSVMLFGVFKYRSGNMGIAVSSITIDGLSVLKNAPIGGLSITVDTLTISNNNNSAQKNSGNIICNLTVPSGSACTFDVYVYGIQKP